MAKRSAPGPSFKPTIENKKHKKLNSNLNQTIQRITLNTTIL